MHDRKTKEGTVLTTYKLIVGSSKKAMLFVQTAQVVRLGAVPGKHHEANIEVRWQISVGDDWIENDEPN